MMSLGTKMTDREVRAAALLLCKIRQQESGEALISDAAHLQAMDEIRQANEVAFAILATLIQRNSVSGFLNIG